MRLLESIKIFFRRWFHPHDFDWAPRYSWSAVEVMDGGMEKGWIMERRIDGIVLRRRMTEAELHDFAF